ncbi:MAG: sigma-54-dependent Fis family transcriptional regulator [Planctomycetota bacterium]|nr:MAG: sigma-54-dependent Fis family transcriptional regulator [Planctomycetota bacterium]
MSERILVVDDEARMRLGLREVLERAGYEVETASDGDEAIARIDRGGLDVVITDLRMPGSDGLAVLTHAKAKDPTLLVYMISAHGDIQTAVEAMKRGAADFIQKPFKIDEVRARVRAGLDQRELKSTAPRGDAAGGPVDEGIWEDFPEIAGRSPALGRVLHTVRKVAPSPLPVLVLGETGTGKELIARALHRLSGRQGPFVATTGHLPAGLVESELFGHARGSFTGAHADKAGYFESASGGTFFLDEVGDLPLGVQVKLLRVIQEREVVRVGESKARKIDARLVAATNKDLEAEVAAKRFREDLLYRLNVITVVLPPLRERGEDVVLLAERFLAEAGRQAGRALSLSASAREALRELPWPGNVRQLRHACESLAYLAESEVVEASDVRAAAS